MVIAPAPRDASRRRSRSAATASDSCPMTAPRSTSWSPGASRSTRPTAPARRAPASGPSSSSTRSCSSPTAREHRRRRARHRRPAPTEASWRLKTMEAVCKSHGWDIRVPVRDLPPEALEYLLYARKDEKVVVRYRHERGENTLQRDLRGRRHQPRAALPRDGLRVHQDRAREVHGRAAVPDVRRQAPQAGGAGRHHRRPEHLGRRDAVGDRRADLDLATCPTG